MPPEDIPEDREISYPCDLCGGSVTKTDDAWECDTCDFKVTARICRQEKV